MVSLQSSAIATSHRFRMARETLAPCTANQKCESSHNSSQGCYFENIVSREVFEKRKFFILWICLRVRMDSRNRSFSRTRSRDCPFTFRAERLASSFARIGTPRLHACMPWTTHSFSTSMISAIVAPCRRRVLMRPPRLSRLLGRQHPRDALRRACLLRTAEEVRLC
jgi:hypothetical protein